MHQSILRVSRCRLKSFTAIGGYYRRPSNLPRVIQHWIAPDDSHVRFRQIFNPIARGEQEREGGGKCILFSPWHSRNDGGTHRVHERLIGHWFIRASIVFLSILISRENSFHLFPPWENTAKTSARVVFLYWIIQSSFGLYRNCIPL